MDAARMHPAPEDARPPVAVWRFGDFVFDALRGVLRGPGGAETTLRPKTAELLRHLLGRAGRLVTRDALMEAVWPEVVVGDDSITQCVAEIRRALGEAGPRLLRTMPKRGYLLAVEAVPAGTAAAPKADPPPAWVAPEGRPMVVEVPEWPGAGSAAPESAPPLHRHRRRLAVLAGAAGLALAGLLGAGAAWRVPVAPTPAPPPQPAAPVATPSAPAPPAEPTAAPVPVRRRSFVVLPFANLGGDPEGDGLAEGIAQQLADDLGRIPTSFVIGPGTAFAHKGRAVDPRRIGRELGVRYVLEGSVQPGGGPGGGQIAVAIRLHDSTTGAQLWADRFGLPRAGPDELPRLVSARTVRPLAAEVVVAERDRSLAERPDNPDLPDLMMRGYAAWFRTFTREASIEGRHFFERAVALDERHADAHAALGGTCINAVGAGWSRDPEADLAAGERHLARAIAPDSRNVQAHYWRGLALALRWRFEEAVLAFDPVIASNRDAARGHGARGWVRLLTGRPAEAAADIAEAIRLGPRDPVLAYWIGNLGLASLMLGREAEALGHLMRAVALQPGNDARTLNLASAYALLGRTEEARATLQDLRRRRPEVTIAAVRAFWTAESPDPTWRAMRGRQLEGLRLAGLPEE